MPTILQIMGWRNSFMQMKAMNQFMCTVRVVIRRVSIGLTKKILK